MGSTGLPAFGSPGLPPFGSPRLATVWLAWLTAIGIARLTPVWLARFASVWLTGFAGVGITTLASVWLAGFASIRLARLAGFAGVWDHHACQRLARPVCQHSARRVYRCRARQVCQRLARGLASVWLTGFADVGLAGLATIRVTRLTRVWLASVWVAGLASVWVAGFARVWLAGLATIRLTGLARVGLTGLARVGVAGFARVGLARFASVWLTGLASVGVAGFACVGRGRVGAVSTGRWRTRFGLHSRVAVLGTVCPALLALSPFLLSAVVRVGFLGLAVGGGPGLGARDVVAGRTVVRVARVAGLGLRGSFRSAGWRHAPVAGLRDAVVAVWLVRRVLVAGIRVGRIRVVWGRLRGVAVWARLILIIRSSGQILQVLIACKVLQAFEIGRGRLVFFWSLAVVGRGLGGVIGPIIHRKSPLVVERLFLALSIAVFGILAAVVGCVRLLLGRGILREFLTSRGLMGFVRLVGLLFLLFGRFGEFVDDVFLGGVGDFDLVLNCLGFIGLRLFVVSDRDRILQPSTRLHAQLREVDVERSGQLSLCLVIQLQRVEREPSLTFV